MVLGLLCVVMLVMSVFMKTSLGSDDAPDSTYTRVARKLVWAVATSQYLCGFDRMSVCILYMSHVQQLQCEFQFNRLSSVSKTFQFLHLFSFSA